MSRSNGRANGKDVVSASETQIATLKRFTPDEINRYTSELEVPFDPHVIEWRVTSSNQQKTRGQVVPYADQRAYTDRLNAVFTPAGWTRKYMIHTSANFERSKDQKVVAKVLVSCELTIFGLGVHSATGEEWADNDNAGTSAEAQSFKRACSCFGLGRYLYYFTGTWVDLDDHKRPKPVPQLAGWATPAGWLQGLRPNCVSQQKPRDQSRDSDGQNNGQPKIAATGANNDIVCEIEQMERVVGKRMYRGLLKSVARVWTPRDIQNPAMRQRVLAHLQAAQRGLGRLDAVVRQVGLDALFEALRNVELGAIDQVDNLETLHALVINLERTLIRR